MSTQMLKVADRAQSKRVLIHDLWNVDFWFWDKPMMRAVCATVFNCSDGYLPSRSYTRLFARHRGWKLPLSDNFYSMYPMCVLFCLAHLTRCFQPAYNGPRDRNTLTPCNITLQHIENMHGGAEWILQIVHFVDEMCCNKNTWTYANARLVIAWINSMCSKYINGLLV